ncbi:MAG: hypothetical protein ACI4RM_03130 [Ruminococcus sp.]
MKSLDLQNKFKDGKFKNIVIIMGIVGIGLIFISTLSAFNPSEQKDTSYSVTEYKDDMQSSVENLLSQVDGVGNVTVLLTIENSVECVYLENNSTKTKEIEPIIRGVVVACDGGDDPIVIERVLNVVTKALNISSAKVCITKLQE